MLKLDFSIVTIDERSLFISNFFALNPNFSPSQHALDTITNYILYGKDPYINKAGALDPSLPPEKWTNMSARHEIDINTKYSTWKRREPTSLEEVMESPTFNEGALLIQQPSLRAPRPTIDRAQEANVPTMATLWQTIDQLSARLEDPNLTATQRYKLQHTLIELRQQQFMLKDIFKPVIQAGANRSIYILSDSELEIDWEAPDGQCGFAPMGLYHPGDLRFEAPLSIIDTKDNWGYNQRAPCIIDFRNPDHIDKLIVHYGELETYLTTHFLSSQKSILDTLEYYITNTKLSAPQLTILRLKIARMTNIQISRRVNAEFNKTYRPNYISTIYRKVCARLSETALRIYTYYYERINPSAFKQCTKCKKLKLATADEFTRKSRNKTDGLSSRCKECEKNGNNIT